MMVIGKRLIVYSNLILKFATNKIRKLSTTSKQSTYQIKGNWRRPCFNIWEVDPGLGKGGTWSARD